MTPYGHAPSWEKFSTLGKNPAEVPDGIMAKLEKLVKSDNVKQTVKEIISSGVDIPKIVRIVKNTSLYKIVPKGTIPSINTPFWITKNELQNILSAGKLEQSLGLPLSSTSLEYELYEISPINIRNKITIFESIIAPTVEGSYKTIGGAKQLLVPDRKKWTVPKKIYQIDLNKRKYGK